MLNFLIILAVILFVNWLIDLFDAPRLARIAAEINAEPIVKGPFFNARNEYIGGPIEDNFYGTLLKNQLNTEKLKRNV